MAPGPGIYTTAAAPMANSVSVTTAELSIVAAIGRAVRAKSVKITKQADTSLAIAAVITSSRPGGRCMRLA